MKENNISRRSFIKTLGAVGTVTATTSLLSCNNNNDTQTSQVGPTDGEMT